MWNTFLVIAKISLGILLAMCLPLLAFTTSVITVAYYYGGIVTICLSPALFLVILYVYIYYFCHQEKRKRTKKSRKRRVLK